MSACPLVEKWKQGSVTLAKLLDFSEPRCPPHWLALNSRETRHLKHLHNSTQVLRSTGVNQGSGPLLLIIVTTPLVGKTWV